MNDYENISRDDSIDEVIYFNKRPCVSRPEKEPTSDNDSNSDDSIE